MARVNYSGEKRRKELEKQKKKEEKRQRKLAQHAAPQDGDAEPAAEGEEAATTPEAAEGAAE
ncbi:MAG: hypothetical protein ACR2ID_11005 [Chthoniobacterales bacterium]